VREVATAAELAAAFDMAFADCDLLLMAAAVADFRPRDPALHKLKKSDRTLPRTLELEPTPDILGGLAARRRPGQVLVGFAAEHGPGGLEHARDKLARKGLDAIVLNDVSRPGIGFDAADNEVTVITADGRELELARAGKETIADGVLDRVQELWITEGGEDVRRAVGARPARV
jgi:phosphopantothenoylcysteine decarboxylase / phosphopantothenate---cysteine ligase